MPSFYFILILLYNYSMDDKKQIYYQYFQDEILPVIRPLELERVKTVKKVIFTSVLFFLTGVVFAVLFLLNAIYSVINPLVLPFLLLFMYTFIIKSIINVIIAGKDYQKMLVKEVLPLFFEPFARFRKWSEKDLDTVLTSKLFGNFDELEENLCMFGYYKNTAVRISDTALTLPVRSSNKSYLFKGTMIKLEFPNSIDNHVILLSKNQCKANKFKQINPHIADLNKYLYCFAQKTDSVNFITEDFWKKIKTFGEIYTAKSFLFSYKDNVVLIALKQKNPMQFGLLFKSLIKAKNYDELINRFIIVFDLIDLLNA